MKIVVVFPDNLTVILCTVACECVPSMHLCSHTSHSPPDRYSDLKLLSLQQHIEACFLLRFTAHLAWHRHFYDGVQPSSSLLTSHREHRETGLSRMATSLWIVCFRQAKSRPPETPLRPRQYPSSSPEPLHNTSALAPGLSLCPQIVSFTLLFSAEIFEMCRLLILHIH